MASRRPTILLVPGAFARLVCFDRLVGVLKSKGYETICCTYPSSDPPQADDCSSAADAAHIRETYLIPLIREQQKEVVIFAHSYGAICGGAAATGLAHQDVEKDGGARAGGIVGLIYLAGTPVPGGMSLMDVFPGGGAIPFFRVDHPRKGCAVIEPVIDILYGDADAKDFEQLEAGMTPHALAAFGTKSPPQVFEGDGLSGRRVYIRTSEDRCQPPSNQDLFLKSTGVHWAIEEMQASHGAFFTQPEGVGAIIDKYVSTWIDSGNS